MSILYGHTPFIEIGAVYKDTRIFGRLIHRWDYTQGGLYTWGAIHEYKEVVSFVKLCVNSMGNRDPKSSIFGVFCVYFMKNNCKTTKK